MNNKLHTVFFFNISISTTKHQQTHHTTSQTNNPFYNHKHKRSKVKPPLKFMHIINPVSRKTISANDNIRTTQYRNGTIPRAKFKTQNIFGKAQSQWHLAKLHSPTSRRTFENIRTTQRFRIDFRCRISIAGPQQWRNFAVPPLCYEYKLAIRTRRQTANVYFCVGVFVRVSVSNREGYDVLWCGYGAFGRSWKRANVFFL